MKITDTITPEAQLLIEAVCNGIADDAQLRDLESLLLTDEKARRSYAYLLELDANLQWLVGSQYAGGAALAKFIAAKETPSVSPAPTFPATLLHSMVGYFSSGWPVAYLVATVILGIGLTIGAFTYVSQPGQVATHSLPPAAEHPLAPESLPASVGRITGMVDCKWAGAAVDSTRVTLGQKFELTSGLMEIAYDRGAKVILQGPATYEVDSKNGGFLPIGKLTGKVEVEKAKGFSVRTPTATITDLGTEFGVEVQSDGTVETHVFVGEVRVDTAKAQEDLSQGTQVIRAGQSVLVKQGERLSVSVRNSNEAAQQFIRAIPAPSRRMTENTDAEAYAKLVLSMNPAVYYRMDEWPKTDRKDSYLLIDSANGGHHGELHVDPVFDHPRCSGRFGAALELHSTESGTYAIVPDYPQSENRQLSVSAWVWAVSGGYWASIVDNWSHPDRGQFFFGMSDRLSLTAHVRIHGNQEVFVGVDDLGKMLPRRNWQHVAFVADGDMLRLYRNGAEVGAVPCEGPDPESLLKGLFIGGNRNEVGTGPHSVRPGFWNGRLDELAIFNHALTAEQVRQLYVGSEVPRNEGAK
jgi:hypothetical protein